MAKSKKESAIRQVEWIVAISTAVIALGTLLSGIAALLAVIK